MRKFMLLGFVFIIVMSLVPAFSVNASSEEPRVQVKLKNYLGNKSQITVVPDIAYSTNIKGVTLLPKVNYSLEVTSEGIRILENSKEIGRGIQIDVKPITEKGPLSINGRLYLGDFSFTKEGNYVRPINSIGLEDYLKGVVPAEMPASWNDEALKSQAVAARTYAMGYGKTIDDTTTYQVYGGYSWYEKSSKAVDDTKGQVIAYNGKPIGSDAFFTSSNGGVTETNSNVWGGTARPYLTIKQDPYDPKTKWSFGIKKVQIDTSKLDLTKADTWWNTVGETEQTAEVKNMKSWLTANGYGTNIKIIGVPQLSFGGVKSGGRVTTGSITIDYFTLEQGKAVSHRLVKDSMNASSIRAIFGLSLMKSYLVQSVSTTGDRILVTGAGYGHGVGLSQYGARNAGDPITGKKNYKEILAFYYENTNIISAYQADPVNPVPVNPTPAPVIPAPVQPAPPLPVPVKDETAPVINNIETSYDSKTQKVYMRYDVNETAKITLQVKDGNSKIIAAPLKEVQTSAGTRWVSWVASNAANGNYTLTLTAVDGSNNKSTATIMYTLKKPVPKDTSAPVLKNILTSFDSKTQKVYLRYDINETAKMTLQVKDGNSKIIATPIKDAQTLAGTRWVSWAASNAANGNYTLTLTAVDGSSNKTNAMIMYTLKKPIPKDTSAPVLKNIKTSFDSKSQKVYMRYDINETAKMTLQVKDGNSKVIATPIKDAQTLAGTRWVSWAASNAATGNYTLILTAVDGSNNKRTTNISYTLSNPVKKMTGKVSATSLIVRQTPSTSGKAIGSLKKNTIVTINRKNGDWYEIQFSNGKAFVSGKYITNVITK
ncbi:SpoIID/LytB domain-containing protein [Peribacillus kribbensis]|uniref:SpoIID/LytB domain-containing protein n=1 Tax=Peribacillus kribbensis TaxID=356658 RepID=UPI0012DFE43C|nr:SpoIID/LytB domain-containing protein [Peribacillus kribbensis]